MKTNYAPPHRNPSAPTDGRSAVRPIFLRPAVFPWRSALAFAAGCVVMAVWLALDPIVLRLLP
jgi:hypothetical protein